MIKAFIKVSFFMLSYFLSTLYFPGPIKIRAKHTMPNSMACDAPLKPSPLPKWTKAAMIMVKTNKMFAGRKNSPKSKKKPPKVSVAAAIKPQKAGRKSMPITFMLPPRPVQPSTPPEIFGKPCTINMAPKPILIIKRPVLRYLPKLSNIAIVIKT